MKYKVFYDSNQLFKEDGSLGEPFSATIPTLHKLLKDNKKRDLVSICLSEVVIKERIQHRLEKIESSIKIVNEHNKALEVVGYKSEKIISIGEKAHLEVLEKNISNFIEKYTITKVLNGTIDIDNLVKRCISKIKPFNDKGVGLKDTLIYLSMVEDGQNMKEPTTYIFCTQNKDQFDDEVSKDFEKITGKKLFIVPTTEKIKEKLDELLPLSLHLEKRNNKIKQFLLGNVGTITKLVNDRLLQKKHLVDSLYAGYSPVTLVGRNINVSDEEKIIGYNYKDISLYNFEEMKTDSYRIDARLSLGVIYAEKQKGFRNVTLSDRWETINENILATQVYAHNALNTMSADNVWRTSDSVIGAYNRPDSKTIDVSIICNPDTESIDIQSIF
jgi:hypothetical protein